jgi:thioredoxin 1
MVILAYASWCVDSRRILPVFERISNSADFCDVAFIQVKIEVNPEVKKALGVQRYPTLYLFKNGEKLEEQIAEVPESEQEAIIRTLAQKAKDR